MIAPPCLEGERWAAVPWYPERYAVSSFGRVFNKETGKFKTPHMLWSGRTGRRPKDSIVVRLHRIDIDNTGKHQTEVAKIVARLVLEAFVGPCPINQVARAKDNDLANARLDNLYWGPRSQRENAHKYAIKLKPEQANEIRERSRRAYDGDGFDRRNTLVALSREFGCSKTMIADIRDGRSWQVAGDTWSRETRRTRRDGYDWTISQSENSGISTYYRLWRV